MTNDIGASIRDARRRNLLTQRQLADLAGVSERTVREVERGSTSVGLAAVIALATAVGLRIEAR